MQTIFKQISERCDTDRHKNHEQSIFIFQSNIQVKFHLLVLSTCIKSCKNKAGIQYTKSGKSSMKSCNYYAKYSIKGTLADTMGMGTEEGIENVFKYQISI